MSLTIRQALSMVAGRYVPIISRPVGSEGACGRLGGAELIAVLSQWTSVEERSIAEFHRLHE